MLGNVSGSPGQNPQNQHLKVHRLEANVPIICLVTLAADMGTGLHALGGGQAVKDTIVCVMEPRDKSTALNVSVQQKVQSLALRKSS